MENFNIELLTPQKHVHFVGIGGISMSSLAKILYSWGCTVSGSDCNCTDITEKLEKCGIKVFNGHSAENVSGADLVVYTAAVDYSNPELVYAKNHNIPIIERCVLLGELMHKFGHAINISGTHGKTTTTSMMAIALIESGLNPTVTVGGELSAIGGNLKIGANDYFVTEACEYVDSFLHFYPTIAVITNIDADHLDYFKDINAIIKSFNKFATKIPENGLLVINDDDNNTKKALDRIKCNIYKCSTKNNTADFFADNILFDEGGYASFDLFEKGNFVTKVTLNVPGIHNVYNSLSVFAVCSFLKLNLIDISKYIKTFTGTKRRFEKKGYLHNACIIDDYAHHPTEITATLKTARDICKGKLYCVFQPHTYTRTKALLNEFAQSLSFCDEAIITDIYAAREKDTGTIHSTDLVKLLKNGRYIKDFKDIKKYLFDNAKPNDIIITMGAGTVYKIGEEIVE